MPVRGAGWLEPNHLAFLPLPRQENCKRVAAILDAEDCQVRILVLTFLYIYLRQPLNSAMTC